MSEELLDDAEAHTLAKHKILQEYLKAWLPILGQGQSNRLLYFDGFAGCGELTGGHPGSPVVAIRTALEGKAALNVPFEVQMVELNPERHQYLLQKVRQERDRLGDVGRQIRVLDPICGECEATVTALLDDHARQRKPLGPALFFLDQYGYKGFSMNLVRRILQHEKCETFSYLNWQRMHPYFTDPIKADTLTRALGSDKWREVQHLEGQSRVRQFKEIYIAALRDAGAMYVYDFAMRGPDHRLIYWLFFCSKSVKGLEVMKKAMWKVDSTGAFEFSDRDATQGILMGYTSESLANDLDRQLRGRELTSDELKEHVLTNTPEYRFDDALKILKKRETAKEIRRDNKTVYVFCAPPMRTRSMFGEDS